MADFFCGSTVLLELWFGWYLLLHLSFFAIFNWLIFFIPPLFYCYYELADCFCCTPVLLQLLFGWFILLHDYFIIIITSLIFLFHHHLIAIIIWLISSMAPLSYYNYDWADFSYCTTVLLQLLFGWFLRWDHCFYCNYNLNDFFYWASVLLQLKFVWFHLLHHCFIAIRTWLNFPLASLFYCQNDLPVFFYSITVLLQLWIGSFLLWQQCLITIII